jgi:hypothetical protein
MVGEPNDNGRLIPAAYEDRNIGRLPEIVYTDAGYFNPANQNDELRS